MRGSSSSDHRRILGVDAEALHEALVAQHADGRLRRVEVEEADVRVRRRVAERRRRPLPDQPACLEVVGGERRVGGVDRLERRVERDDENAHVARLLHRRHHRLGVGGRDQDAVDLVGDAGLDRRHLGLVVAVDPAGVALQLHAELIGLGLRALLHLHEERIGVGLGDQAGRDRLVLRRRWPCREREKPCRREQTALHRAQPHG
jgi:hypothetical protein